MIKNITSVDSATVTELSEALTKKSDDAWDAYKRVRSSGSAADTDKAWEDWQEIDNRRFALKRAVSAAKEILGEDVAR